MWCNARKVNPRIELNLWLANHEVNLRVEQPALKALAVNGAADLGCMLA